MAGWDHIKNMFILELKQQVEEGYEVDEGFYLIKLHQTKNDQEVEILFEQMKKAKKNINFPYDESNDLQIIIKDSKTLIPAVEKIDFDFFYGAMIGRCIGCSLGKPLEVGPYFWESTKYNPGWENVKKWFAGAGQYPIRDYVPAHSSAEKTDGLYVGNPTCVKENIHYMETDDDIRYTLVSLEIMERKGFEFEPYDVGKMWHELLPYQFLCTAETQAYLNFARVTSHIGGNRPNELKGDLLDFVREHINPYREWIGAQIRCDGYAYAAAGKPVLAAKMAYSDAALSHVKNGIYGAMFFAALIASAFTTKDIHLCITQALEIIPKKSRLYEYIIRTIRIAEVATNQEQMIETIWEYLPDFNMTHTINNACVCVASIIFGQGDFDLSVTTSVLFGMDTDCNGATVGSFMGAFIGEKRISDHWKKPLNDTIYALMPNYHPISIVAISKRFHDLYEKQNSLAK